MKVKYIGEYYKVRLKKDAIYDVISSENGWYKIIDELGKKGFFPPGEFDWANETLKEVPFWRDDMQPEEYDIEREYLAKHWGDYINGEYIPLWKQKKNKN